MACYRACCSGWPYIHDQRPLVALLRLPLRVCHPLLVLSQQVSQQACGIGNAAAVGAWVAIPDPPASS